MRQTLYCAVCGMAQDCERAAPDLGPCDCGSTVFTTMAPVTLTLTPYDKRFLGSLRITLPEMETDA